MVSILKPPCQSLRLKASFSTDSPGSMLVLRELKDMLSKIGQCQMRSAVVSANIHLRNECIIRRTKPQEIFLRAC